MDHERRRELEALNEHRQQCREAWRRALHSFATTGDQYPSIGEYERMQKLLASLKLSQQLLDDFQSSKTGGDFVSRR